MAQGSLGTIAYDQDDRTRLDEGKLLLIDNVINQSAGTAELKATFPNAKGKLWPGEFVNVQLVLATRPNAISVPSSAVQQGQNGSFVFVVEPEQTVTARAVDVAETLRDHVLERSKRLGEMLALTRDGRSS